MKPYYSEIQKGSQKAYKVSGSAAFWQIYFHCLCQKEVYMKKGEELQFVQTMDDEKKLNIHRKAVMLTKTLCSH